MQHYTKFRFAIKNNRGATAIVVAISLIILIGFLAFAVDIGHLFVARNQLQNAADAAALAGASYLSPQPQAEVWFGFSKTKVEENWSVFTSIRVPMR